MKLERELMARLLETSEIPNLLDLVEARTEPGALDDLSIREDDFGRLPSSPVDLSLCGDDQITPPDLSPCADELESDVRLKTDIEQVGTTVYGLPLYHFRYKTGPERFEGVMAQDVLEVMPDAVVRGEDGYYRVKYAELGIRMTRA
jgi:endosialidase-like protein